MDYEKLIYTLASIFAGWSLAQVTGVIKDFLCKKKIQKCLIEELEELQTELNRTLIIYSRQLQIYSLQCIDNGCATPLSNHIFKNYYKDVVQVLNKNQRISFQLIHTLIENINIRIKELDKVTGDLQKKHVLEGEGSISNAECKSWGEAIKVEFHNVSMAIWHIKFHLDNPKSPDLSPYTKEHEQYLQYLESVYKNVQKIMEEAKNLNKKDFERIYNPNNFAK